jgi:hypothetical protein
MVKNSVLILLSSLFLLSCDKPNLDLEEKAILRLLKNEQRAHLEKNADLLISNGVPGSFMVNRGEVSQPTDKEISDRFNRYFGSVNFLKWEDTANPIIRFSDDASLAYAIIQKQVILTRKEDVTSKPDTTDFAWISIWRKANGKWKMESMASTNKP